MRRVFFWLFIFSLIVFFYLKAANLLVTDFDLTTKYMQFFYDELRKGYLIPRWTNQLNDGYGSPILISLPPLVNYLGSAIHALTRLPFSTISKLLFFDLNLLFLPLSLIFFKNNFISILAFSALLLINSPQKSALALLIPVAFWLYRQPGLAKRLWLTITAALCLTAFYWLPASLEVKAINNFLTANPAEFLVQQVLFPANKIQLLSDTNKVKIVKVYKNRFHWYGVKTVNNAAADFQLNTFYYPGWQVFFDNQPIAINSQNQPGLNFISFSIPKAPDNDHIIAVVFTKTKPRLIAESLSAAALALLICSGGYAYFKKST